VKRSEGVTHCPAHADAHPSLNINQRGAQVLVHCFTGCEQAAVIQALGDRGLWADASAASVPALRAERRRQQKAAPKAATAPAAVPQANRTGLGPTELYDRAATVRGTPGAGYLAQRAVPLELAEAAGVRYAADFLGRAALLFPLRTQQGELVAVHGRYVEDTAPKARTIGPKAEAVFPTPGALDSAPLVVCEAPLDAFALAAAGSPCIAVCGTSWPAWLADHARQHGSVWAGDADAAGDEAGHRWEAATGSAAAYARWRPVGGKDWNELLQRAGPAALRTMLAAMPAPLTTLDRLVRELEPLSVQETYGRIARFIGERALDLPSADYFYARAVLTNGVGKGFSRLAWDGCAAAERERRAAAARGPRGAETEGGAASKATALVRIGQRGELFHTADLDGYATITVDGHHETWAIRSSGFKSWLRREYLAVEGAAPGSEAITAAVDTLEALAQFDGPERVVFLRIGVHEGRIYIDLGDPRWQAVEIDAEGWRIVAHPPVRFRRGRGALPLPEPVAGGSVDDLRPFLHLPDEAAFRSVVSFLVMCWNPWGPYPLLALSGEQGSAKSTTARVLRALIDPATAPLRSLPRDERDLAVAATNAWLVTCDNISTISDWLSDALSRLTTGGGVGTRTLYTDREETIFDHKRPVLLTGIESYVTKGDLGDRAIPIVLPPFEEATRRDERSLWADFEAARPRILGALFAAVSSALGHRDSIRLERLPRMADYAVWSVAAAPALGWTGEDFLAAYAEALKDAASTALEASAIAQAVLTFVEKRGAAAWEGTAGDLLKELGAEGGPAAQLGIKTSGKGWPADPTRLSGELRRVAPALRRAGVEVWFQRDKRARRLTLQPSPPTRGESSVTSVTSVIDGGFAAPPGVEFLRNRGDAAADVSVTAPIASVTQRHPTGSAHAWGDADDADDADLRTFSERAREVEQGAAAGPLAGTCPVCRRYVWQPPDGAWPCSACREQAPPWEPEQAAGDAGTPPLGVGDAWEL
jgi:hypothetical protein